MEESNIRWGEIVGGLLIIGCSTALVVSLWSQISQIPVLKFLIFTTVTAVLFSIGMYTEHRWKLPTTSRGILTIATLLVPLNFLAIAAVSSSDTSGLLVLGSELLAPAIFLCLVYFAGRVIAPGCAHLLAAGILGSSVGQILVRHFASVDAPPELLVFLGAFPVACYLIAVGMALRRVLADHKIDESETSTIFTILGTMSFAALLPFGLLLYKSGPIGMTMMYLAPLVTLWGVPMLATGTVLWRRIVDKSLVASRTAGTALGILGLMIVLAGMILAWPNPASIVPAAILNFAIFTALAIALELPVAHLIANGCFALAYLVSFHVLSGNVRWQNLRVESLVDITLQISSGQVLTGAFALLLIASEWLRHKRRIHESIYYLTAACLIGIISLAIVTGFGPIGGSEVQSVWMVYAFFALGAFWIAWRRQLTAFTWVGSGLLLFALASGFAWASEYSFPWQTALLVQGTICAVAAILSSRRTSFESLSKPLNYASLISIGLAVISLFQTNHWQVTSMQAERVFWIAGVVFVSHWLNRRHELFVSLQLALTGAVILSVKAALQQFEWYTYLPHAFLHPWGLQIQGTMLALLSLAWIAVRFGVKRLVPNEEPSLSGLWKLLNTKYSIDRIIPWVLLGGFVLLSVYGAASGITQEFALRGADYQAWNIAGFPHQEAFAIGSWIIMGLLTLIMLANAWERRQPVYFLGAMVAVSAVVPLLAGRFETQLAAATAWRFLAVGFFLAGSVLLWRRDWVRAQLSSCGCPSLNGDAETSARHIRTLLILLTVAPVLLLTIYPALRAMAHAPVQTPVTGVFSLFANDFLYAVPLVVVALVLIGHGIRERSPLFCFYAGLLFNLTVTLAYVLSVVSVNAPLDGVVLVRTVQLNAITFAVYALAWLSVRGRWLTALENRAGLADKLLKLVTRLAGVLNVALLVPLVLELISGNEPGSATLAAGSLLGWFAFVVTLASFVLVKLSRSESFFASTLATMLMSVVCLIAFGLTGYPNSIELRMLTVGTTVVAWLMFAASLPESIGSIRFATFAETWSKTAQRLSAVLGAGAVFLSLRLLPVLDRTDWWRSIATLVTLSALAASLNWRILRRRYLYAAGMLLNIAVSIWYVANVQLLSIQAFLEINIVAASLTGILWLLLELRARKSEVRLRSSVSSYHNSILVCSVSLLISTTLFRFVVGSEIPPELRQPELTWFALLATTGLMFATLWDRHAKYSTAGLYTLGLLAGAIGLQQLYLTLDNLVWSALMILALYSLGASLLWRKREVVIELAERIGITSRLERTKTHLAWLAWVTALALLIVGSIAYGINLRFLSFELRVTAALAVAAQSVTLGLLAEGVWRERWQRASIAAFLVGFVLVGWSWLTPGVTGTWLNRSVILMVLAFAFTAIYALVLKKVRAIQIDWANSIRACMPALLSAGVVALVFCLSTEVFYKVNFGEVRIHPVSLVAIGVTLIAAVVIPVLFALWPDYDPLGASDRGRMKYTYTAEAMLALLFLHIRLTMPWLFTGFFEDYWPFVVMTVAYFGVVSSEWLRRREVLVIAKPLERTGAFLPLLPVLGFWLAASQVDYSSLLFVVCGLYRLLSILRRSFIFGAMAAIAGNAGLWHFLQRTDDYQFLQHPQMWLIPAAASVLIAAYLNEDELNEEQMAGIRYLSLVTIYVSSTADIFINGVENSPWLPLVLGALSLAGVFSGIMFRIRGLLLMASVFLLLSITTMIWYASENFGWTWFWYVAGIATGATIIFMFAVFEKKRSEVLRVVEGLKEWEI